MPPGAPGVSVGTGVTVRAAATGVAVARLTVATGYAGLVALGAAGSGVLSVAGDAEGDAVAAFAARSVVVSPVAATAAPVGKAAETACAAYGADGVHPHKVNATAIATPRFQRIDRRSLSILRFSKAGKRGALFYRRGGDR